MRAPIFKLFRESPFLKLLEHAEKVQEGGKMFRRAMICHVDRICEEFDQLHLLVTQIESEADAIKRNIRGHLPKGIMMPVDKFQFTLYLREQDYVMDAVQDTLHWISYRNKEIPSPLVEDFMLLVDKAVEAIDQIPPMVKQAIDYFRSFSEADRRRVKEAISLVRRKEFESDQVERKLKSDIFSLTTDDPVTTFHLIRLVEYMGEIANHAENAGDMMRAMIAR
jgi:hypothetical protein